MVPTPDTVRRQGAGRTPSSEHAADARKYVEVLLVTAQSVLAYPLETFSRAGFMAVVIFVFVQLWSATLRLSGRGAAGGYDLPRIVWYLVVTETIIMSSPRLFERIDQEVKGATSPTRSRGPTTMPSFSTRPTWATRC